MKVYIAASFGARTRLRPYRDKLWEMGLEVVSSWLDEVAHPPEMDEATFKKKLAIKDLAEVKSADLLLLDSLETKSGGGKSTEFGIALGKFQSMLIYRVGPARNVFHYLADQTFHTWPECIKFMKLTHGVKLGD